MCDNCKAMAQLAIGGTFKVEGIVQPDGYMAVKVKVTRMPITLVYHGLLLGVQEIAKHDETQPLSGLGLDLIVPGTFRF